MNEDADVNGLDADPFVAAVVGGAGVQAVPEPSSIGLVLIGTLVGLLAGRRRFTRHRGGRAAANQTDAAGTESVTCDPLTIDTSNANRPRTPCDALLSCG